MVVARAIACGIVFAGMFSGLQAQGAPTQASQPADCSGYQALLDEFLVVTSSPGRPLETRFNYTALHQRRDRNMRFALIRRQLFGVTPSLMSDDERLAWAINAYNFLVIEAVTENLFRSPARGQASDPRRERHASVMQMTVRGQKFFDAKLVEIEGRGYSLNAFERRFVFADAATRRQPPQRLDPRAHFALVCAAKGCPPLRPRCYRADSLDPMLDVATRDALASPTHLRWDAATGRLEVSSIFDWYKADFGGPDAAYAFIKQYAPPTVRAEIEAQKKRRWSGVIPWDWDLNHTPDRPD